jgi:peptidoglycan/LPS O-acetylase OafA/YrhL
MSMLSGTNTETVTAADDRAGSGRRAHLPHQPALDGIRGVAVIGVLLFHGEKLTGGYLGVDAFFVLSGFLITSLLLAEHRDFGSTSLRTFWARRARRLFPALLLALVGVAIYAWWIADSSELADIRGDGLATLFYVANWREVTAGFDYFAIFRSPSPLQHTWSLAIEEQFYVVWPLVFVAATRGRDAIRAARRVFAISAVGALGSFVLAQALYSQSIPEFTGGYLERIRQALTEGSANRVYYGTDTRIGAIFLGAALAAWIAMRGPVRDRRSRSLIEAVAWIGVAGLAWAWMTLEGDAPALYRGGLIACGVAVTAVIAAATHPDRGPLARVLSFAPFRAAGLVSYGLYLWHWPIYVWLDEERTDLDGWALLGLRLAVTLVVSLASYRLIEQPIRRGAGTVRSLRIATPAIVLVVVASLVASTAGAPATTAAPKVRGKGGVLVAGDSVAGSLIRGFVAERYRVQSGWTPGCRLLHGDLPFDNHFSNDCPWEAIFEGLIERTDPDVVVLSIGVWDLFDLRPPGADGDLVPGTPAWNDYLEQSLDTAIAVLSARGAGVVLPTLPCQKPIAGSPGFERNESAADIERVLAWNEVLVGVASRHPGVVVAPDLFGYLCPDGEYVDEIDGSVARDDGVHFNDDGAGIVARFLGPSLTDVARRSDRLKLADDVVIRRIAIYGDSIMNEVAPSIRVLMGDRRDLIVDSHAVAGVSLCDLVTRLRNDIAEAKPDIAVVETNGGSFTPCMQADGVPLEPGSDEYLRRSAVAFEDFFEAAESASIPVLVVAPPPAPTAEARTVQADLWRLAQEAAADSGDVRFDRSARDALGGDTWVGQLPCRAVEDASLGCTDGMIVVRSPNRLNFCPSGYRPDIPCREHASGLARYAAATTAAILDLAGPPLVSGSADVEAAGASNRIGQRSDRGVS